MEKKVLTKKCTRTKLMGSKLNISSKYVHFMRSFKQKCVENIRNRLQSLLWVYPKAVFGSPASQACVFGSL